MSYAIEGTITSGNLATHSSKIFANKSGAKTCSKNDLLIGILIHISINDSYVC